MKSLLRLHISVIQDLGDMYGIDTSRDVETMTSRALREGDSFLTITLPKFSDAVLYALGQGNFSSNSLQGFRMAGRLPAFMGGFTRRIFHADGSLLDAPDPEAIRAIRQTCELSKKVRRSVTADRLDAAERQYVSTDESLAALSCSPRFQKELSGLQYVFERLFRDLLDDLDNAVANFALIPRHGPGATAEHLSPAEKWDFPAWLESVEDVFPSTLYAHHNGLRSPLPLVPRDAEPPVRVVFVPKTQKAPRVIAIEPSTRQFVQQALARRMYSSLRSMYPSSLDLYDQRTNGAWAWYGSCSGDVATLDLSEASDRLSCDLVMSLVGNRPHLRDGLVAARSRYAELPRGDIIPLQKFASMGSALTFPIQSMVFFSIIVLAGLQAEGTRVFRSLERFSVFGDDIIVPVHLSASAIDLLETFGLKVNQRKSHVSGKYRESCGEEYFDGSDVSIVRLTRDVPTTLEDADALASTVSFRNFCYGRGLWRTARLLDEDIARLIPFKPAPFGHPSLSRWTYLEVRPERLSPSLQRDEIKRPHLRPIGKKYRVDGEGGLLQWFLDKEQLHGGVSETNPFERSERPVAFAINNRWAPL